jgi:cell division protein ZapA (FtsZ GTPase activity inhibitor)
MSDRVMHTPTPWKTLKGRTVLHIMGAHHGVCQISTTGYKGSTRAELKEYAERAEANAAFIVRAVNCHDELVAALEKARRQLHRCMTVSGNDTEYADAAVEYIDAALSRTKETTNG